MNVHGDSNHQNWAEPSDTHWRIATVRRWNLHLGGKDFCCKSQWWAVKILSGFFLNGDFRFQKIGKSTALEHFSLQQFPTLLLFEKKWTQLRIPTIPLRQSCQVESQQSSPKFAAPGMLIFFNQGLVKRQGKYVPANSENCSQGQLPEGAFPEPESVLTNKTYKKEQEQW